MSTKCGEVALGVLKKLFEEKPELQDRAKEQIKNPPKPDKDSMEAALAGGPSVADALKKFIPADKLGNHLKGYCLGNVNQTKTTVKPVPKKIFDRLGFLGETGEHGRSSIRADKSATKEQITSPLLTEKIAKDLALRGIYALEHMGDLLKRKKPISLSDPETLKISENADAYKICSSAKGALLWDRHSVRTKKTKQVGEQKPFELSRVLSDSMNISYPVRKFVEANPEFAEDEKDLLTERFRPFLSETTLNQYLQHEHANEVIHSSTAMKYKDQVVIKTDVIYVKNLENKVPPLINILVDRSGSMGQGEKGNEKYKQVINALKQQFDKYQALDVEVAFKIAWFDSESGWFIDKEINTKTTKYENFEALLKKAGDRGGALYPHSGTALLKGYRTLLQGIEPGRKVQNIIVTDGFPNMDNVPLHLYHKEAEKIYQQEIIDRGISPADVSAVGFYIEEDYELAREPVEACIAPFALQNRNPTAQNVVLPIRPDLLSDQIGAVSIIENDEIISVSSQVAGAKPLKSTDIETNKSATFYTAVPMQFLEQGGVIDQTYSDGTTMKVEIPKGLVIEEMSPEDRTEFETALVKSEVELRSPNLFDSTENIILGQQVIKDTVEDKEVVSALPVGAARVKSESLLTEDSSKEALIAMGLLDEPSEVMKAGESRGKYREGSVEPEIKKQGRGRGRPVVSPIKEVEDITKPDLYLMEQANKLVANAIAEQRKVKAAKSEMKTETAPLPQKVKKSGAKLKSYLIAEKQEQKAEEKSVADPTLIAAKEKLNAELKQEYDRRYAEADKIYKAAMAELEPKKQEQALTLQKFDAPFIDLAAHYGIPLSNANEKMEEIQMKFVEERGVLEKYNLDKRKEYDQKINYYDQKLKVYKMRMEYYEQIKREAEQKGPLPDLFDHKTSWRFCATDDKRCSLLWNEG